MSCFNQNINLVLFRKCEDNPDLVKKVSDLTTRAFGLLIESSKATDGFCTISHGDCWTNNFMFRYDQNDKLMGMKMLDLQLTRYGRLPLDLAYFFCSSIDDEMRNEKLTELLRHYHQMLTECLVSYGYTEALYPFEKFVADFDDCFTFGFLTGTFICQVGNVFCLSSRKLFNPILFIYK